jgi:hypothetical protein
MLSIWYLTPNIRTNAQIPGPVREGFCCVEHVLKWMEVSALLALRALSRLHLAQRRLFSLCLWRPLSHDTHRNRHHAPNSAAPMFRSSRVMSLAAQYDGLKKLEQTVFDALLQELKEAEVKLIQSVSQLRETQAELKTAESEPIQATAKRDTSEKERTTTQEKLEHVQRELKCFTGMVTHTKAELAQTADGLLNVKTLEREARCTNAKLSLGPFTIVGAPLGIRRTETSPSPAISVTRSDALASGSRGLHPGRILRLSGIRCLLRRGLEKSHRY